MPWKNKRKNCLIFASWAWRRSEVRLFLLCRKLYDFLHNGGVVGGIHPYARGVLRARRLAEGAAAPSGQEKRIFG